MPEVYVAAGSNIEPQQNLARAVAELARAFPGARFSPWYQNHAAGFEGDDFYRVVTWKTDEVPEFAVLKQWMPRRCSCHW